VSKDLGGSSPPWGANFLNMTNQVKSLVDTLKKCIDSLEDANDNHPNYIRRNLISEARKVLVDFQMLEIAETVPFTLVFDPKKVAVHINV
jgi:hypothetical protein